MSKLHIGGRCRNALWGECIIDFSVTGAQRKNTQNQPKLISEKEAFLRILHDYRTGFKASSL